MCDPVSIGVGLIGGMAVSSMMAPKIPNIQPTAPTAPPSPLATQSQKAADVQSMRKANMGGGASDGPSASAGSTLLTGPTGVDPNELKLGKNVLLGA